MTRSSKRYFVGGPCQTFYAIANREGDGGPYCHGCKGCHGASIHHQAGVAHSHDGGNDESLIPQLREHDLRSNCMLSGAEPEVPLIADPSCDEPVMMQGMS